MATFPFVSMEDPLPSYLVASPSYSFRCRLLIIMTVSASTTESGVCDDTWLDNLLERLREHRLHPFVEVIVAWNMSMLCLLYYAISFLTIRWNIITQKYFGLAKKDEFFPLMTSPKGKPEIRSNSELYREIQAKVTEATGSQFESLSDGALVDLIRSDAILRRLVSNLFQKSDVSTVITDTPRWKRLWPRLLELPELPPIQGSDQSKKNAEIMIALILPAFREEGGRILRTLRTAVGYCANKQRVQIIIVNAGQCTDMDQVNDYLASCGTSQSSRIVDYADGGGRGPTLDYGTRFVSSDVIIMTFLHSDTLLPKHWDASVRSKWSGEKRRKKVQATAFLFGQDKSPEGLNGGPFPWGIVSVQLLGNSRAWALNLPYGDHVLSIPVAYYRHVGGFPAQPIMEDYELMDYFRRRARIRDDETLKIIFSMVRTGVRRWQAHGVVYVTLVNALIVIRYQRGWTPDEIFSYYYVRPNKKKKLE